MAAHSSSSRFPSSVQSSTLTHFNQNPNTSISINISCSLLQKSLVPGLPLKYYINTNTNTNTNKKSNSNSNSNSSAVVKIRGSLIDNPILWAGRLCGFYALCKAGFAGSQSNPILSGSGSESEMNDDADLGFSKWLEKFQKNPDKEAAEKRKLVSKWHPTTKGTLRRNYRIPSKPEGRRLLKAIASLLSQDDHFVDAESHKGCQIRRESAHGESVCCNNVRALFDELPTPHLIVEITPFPAGSLTDKDYAKAEKLEKVLRSSPSV